MVGADTVYRSAADGSVQQRFSKHSATAAALAVACFIAVVRQQDMSTQQHLLFARRKGVAIQTQSRT